MKACQLIEEDISSADSSLRDLKPTLVLIGSAAEGTRLVEADKIDVSLKFCALSKHALKMDDDADALAVVVSENAPVLSSYTSSNTRILDYSKFFDFLLRELCSSLKRINDRLPQGLACNVDWVWAGCSGCQKSEDLGLVSFCLDHLPPITHTKIGPCLIFTWTDSGKTTSILTVDLVPLYPLETESNLPGLFGKVFWSLYQQQPAGWQKHCKGIVARDRVLPGMLHAKQETARPLEITIKFLKYSDKKNYVIRPGQALDLKIFEEEEALKETYIYLKALKIVLNVKVSSYFIKKVILSRNLLPELKREDLLIAQRLQLALKDSMLRPFFEEAIDIEEWTRVLSKGDFDTIPLKHKKETPGAGQT